MTESRGAVRLYARLLRFLPSAVRRADGDEMVRTFAAQLAHASRRRESAGAVTRTFGRLPAVILAEWLDRIWDGVPEAERISRFGAIDRLAQTCRHGARSLRRSPAFLWSTVLLLGLGVGAVTTVFTLVDHVMLRPLPYPAQDRLFEVTHGSHSGPLWRGMQELQSVEAWAAASTEEVNLTGVARPEELRAARVTRDFFALFGARPAVGRLLAGDDFESTDRVVLSAGFGSARSAAIRQWSDGPSSSVTDRSSSSASWTRRSRPRRRWSATTSIFGGPWTGRTRGSRVTVTTSSVWRAS